MKYALFPMVVIAWLGFTCPALAALTLVQVNPIQFGTILPNAPTVGGTVRIAKIANTRSVVSGSHVFSSTGTSGLYTIESSPLTPGATVNVTIAEGTIARTGGGTLTVSNITTNMISGSGTGTVTLNGQGKFFLQIGCDLTVGANQPSGNYTGTLTVTLS
jgi:hypothetical protein